jgi:hypothetical protein
VSFHALGRDSVPFGLRRPSLYITSPLPFTRTRSAYSANFDTPILAKDNTNSPCRSLELEQPHDAAISHSGYIFRSKTGERERGRGAVGVILVVRIQIDISAVDGMCTRRRPERRETRDEILQDDVLSLVSMVGTFMVSMVTAPESTYAAVSQWQLKLFLLLCTMIPPQTSTYRYVHLPFHVTNRQRFPRSWPHTSSSPSEAVPL